MTACATTNSASNAEVVSLRAEVRSLREAQSHLEKRLERMEMLASVKQARASRAAEPAAEPTPTPAPEAPATPSAFVTPELAVVKLKPRAEPAPALPVRVDVVEPTEDDMEMFVSASPDEGASGDEALSPRTSDSGLDAAFEQAVAALRTGNVEGGVSTLLGFAEKNPRHARADNALYFSGLGQMGLKDYASAAGTFERLITRYPAGDAVLDGMLRLAECRLRLEQKDDARALYTRILTQFPGTAAATQAEQRLASLSH
ncbi:tol-pal system YbgF family protein [Cystobacter fuscus]|uniref:tol-pal system YbgF family protein n=1 Tax=Cystobacter fuscus TaxID=43 RepID=UPI0037C09DAF